MLQKKGFHYGWVIFAVCFVTIFIALGLVNSPHGLYMVPVTTSLNMSRMQFSLISTFRYIFSMIFNFLFGYFSTKLGLKRTGILGLLSLTSALLLFSFSYQTVLFYLGGVFWGIGTAFASTAFVSTIITNWFHRHRGLVLGIVMCASGLGGVVSSQMVSHWILTRGWRYSYQISAAVVFICACLVTLTVVEPPEKKGLEPIGGKSETQKAARQQVSAVKKLSDALKMPEFYLILLSSFFIGFLNNPIYVSVPAQMSDQGIPVSYSATVMSILFFSVAVSKIILGWVYDHLGYMTTLCLCFMANISGFILLIFVKNIYFYYLFAAVFGFSIPLENLMIPLTVSQVFAGFDFKTFVGIMLAVVFLGMAVGNPLMGLCYDLWGNYQFAFVFCLVISVVVFMIMSSVVRRQQHKRAM